MKFLTSTVARIIFAIPPLLFGIYYAMVGLSSLEVEGEYGVDAFFFLISIILIFSSTLILFRKWIRLASVILAVILPLLAIPITLSFVVALVYILFAVANILHYKKSEK